MNSFAQLQALATETVPPPEHPLTYDEFTELVKRELAQYGAAYAQQRFDELYRRQLIDEDSFKAHAVPRE